MPRVKIDYVKSFSSEDTENPASNLLEPEVSRKKWLGNKGEASQSVVLQLAKSTRIQSVTVGSHHSALVEVLVGRSEKPLEPFKVLVLSSIFMTPAESKKGENVSKVRTFQYEQLCPDTRDQSWDRIRVVCLQPYNKHVKYGLSFIHIFEPECAKGNEASTSKMAAPVSVLHSSPWFKVTANSSDDEETFRPGELFAKRTSQLSVDAQIRRASKPNSLTNSTETPSNLSRLPISANKQQKQTKNMDKPVPQENVSRDRDSLLYKDEESPNDKIDKIIQRDREEKEKNKESKHKSNERRSNRENNSSKDRSRDRSERNHTPKHNHRVPEDGRSAEHRASSKNKEKTTEDSKTEKMSSNKDRKEDSGKKDKERSSRSDFDRRLDDNKKQDNSHAPNKRPLSDDSSIPSTAKRLKGQLMSDVVFVISGYQNPMRSSLRDKAVNMGAHYRRDWGHGCTHLICAFPNTPKLRQVRSQDDRAAIVKAEWIEECCSRRRRLPWRWFATEPDRRVARQPYSDAENGDDSDDNDCDTDEEIQKLIVDHKSPPCKADPVSEAKTIETRDKTLNSSHDSDVSFVRDERVKEEISISDSETDAYTDEEKPAPTDKVEIDPTKTLPDFFEGFTFAIDLDLTNLGFDCGLLKRYIMAYSGEIVEHISSDSTVNYIISKNPVCPMQKKVKNAVIIKPGWIWCCHKEQKKVKSKDFKVTISQ